EQRRSEDYGGGSDSAASPWKLPATPRPLGSNPADFRAVPSSGETGYAEPFSFSCFCLVLATLVFTPRPPWAQAKWSVTQRSIYRCLRKAADGSIPAVAFAGVLAGQPSSYLYPFQMAEPTTPAVSPSSFLSIQNEQAAARRMMEEARTNRKSLKQIQTEERALAEIRECYRLRSDPGDGEWFTMRWRKK
ncbi:MAG: hypothetical protein BJ554DRAFT_5123, partial [Olpidium bornovanus]